VRQNAGRILALAGFKHLISVIKYQEFMPSLKKRCQEGKFFFIYYQQLANNVQSTVSDICF
jgi:hypothetical protein